MCQVGVNSTCWDPGGFLAQGKVYSSAIPKQCTACPESRGKSWPEKIRMVEEGGAAECSGCCKASGHPADTAVMLCQAPRGALGEVGWKKSISGGLR